MCASQACVANGSTASGHRLCSVGGAQCTRDTQLETCGADGQLEPATTRTYACTGASCGGVCVPGSTADRSCLNNFCDETSGADGQLAGLQHILQLLALARSER
jgi:hypothetical protein